MWAPGGSEKKGTMGGTGWCPQFFGEWGHQDHRAVDKVKLIFLVYYVVNLWLTPNVFGVNTAASEIHLTFVFNQYSYCLTICIVNTLS